MRTGGQLSNALAKSDSTNGHGMRGISFLTTDNWLVIKIRHSDWSNSVSTREGHGFCRLQPRRPRQSNRLVKIYSCANSRKIRM